MQISLSKNSEVPLRHQLAEQVVFLITTGQLQPGEELPSVRTLARLLKIHHNTVSEAYQDLVNREWITRKRGSRLTVGQAHGKIPETQRSLDEIINETIQRARDMGYSLQELRARVRERLLAQPADHILVVEEEPGLRNLIRREVWENSGLPVEGCSPQEFESEPSLAIGAQVIAPNHLIGTLKPLVPDDRPAIPMIYSCADAHLNAISRLQNPSIIAVVSISQSLLKTARSLLAAPTARKHTFQEYLLNEGDSLDLKSLDLVFCDTIALPMVRSRQKLRYQLIDSACLEYLASVLNSV